MCVFVCVCGAPLIMFHYSFEMLINVICVQATQIHVAQITIPLWVDCTEYHWIGFPADTHLNNLDFRKWKPQMERTFELRVSEGGNLISLY